MNNIKAIMLVVVLYVGLFAGMYKIYPTYTKLNVAFSQLQNIQRDINTVSKKLQVTSNKVAGVKKELNKSKNEIDKVNKKMEQIKDKLNMLGLGNI